MTKTNQKTQFKQTEIGDGSTSLTTGIPEGWDLIPISQMGEVVTGSTPSTKKDEFYDGRYNLISPANLDNGKYVKDSHKKLSKLGFNNVRPLPKNSILVGCIGNVGKIGMTADDRSATNQQINAVVCNTNYNPDFVYYLFLASRKIFQQRAVKTTVPILNKTKFSNIKLRVPSFSEQKKIAYVLTSIQEAIQKQEEIIEKTKEFKKSLMHKLFTEGTRGEPQKQTEIGLMPESWEAKLVNDLFFIQQGKQVSRKNRIGNNQKCFLRTSNVYWGKLKLSKLDKMNFSRQEEKRYELKEGDLLVCEGGDVGRTAIWHNEIKNCYYQNHLHRLRKKGNNISEEFVLYWMEYAFSFANVYFGRANITTIPNLSKTRLSKFQIPYPCFQEQEEIINTLASIEIKTKVSQIKKQKLEELFKSLLHRLMRGKIRINNLVFEV